MTKKRFKKVMGFIQDNTCEKGDRDGVMDLAEIEDMLNELYEENKKLIEEWEFSFRTELAHHRVAEKELQEKITEQQTTITELNKQNNQLQSELNNFKPVMFQDMQKGTVILYTKGGIDE